MKYAALITQPFFELYTSDFVWKFIWTGDQITQYKKFKKCIKNKSTKTEKYKCKEIQKYRIAKTQNI